MELISKLIDLFLHLDKHLNSVIQDYGVWTYLILFAVIFCETGLVVTPFLPGDSLLFAAGALSATPGSTLDVKLIYVLLTLAAILGDSTNYWIGRFIGPKVFSGEKIRFLNRKHLDRTQAFYEKHGGKTVVIARFMPIIRTFAPFVAGIGRMSYTRFLTYSVVGSIAWMATFIFGGYFFGNIPIVKNNFSLVIIAILIISVMPAVISAIRARSSKS